MTRYKPIYIYNGPIQIRIRIWRKRTDADPDPYLKKRSDPDRIHSWKKVGFRFDIDIKNQTFNQYLLKKVK